MHIPKWLIATAGLLVVGLIAAIAFFIGRESSRPPAAAVAAPAIPQEVPTVSAPAPEERPPAETSAPTTPIVTAPVNGPVTSPATTSSASLPAPAADHTPAPVEARARVAAYFQQMQAIQSGGIASDQQEFATTIVNAAAGGDFSGIDELVRAATDAERRATALQPPTECAEYHRMAVTLLQESRTMMTTLRDGLKRNDTEALTSVGATAQSMKSRTDSLAAAEKALRARFGL